MTLQDMDYVPLAEMAEELDNRDIMNGMDLLIDRCYGDFLKAGWHDKPMNVGEKIALIHSEISEALEGDRKNLMDDKLPQYKQIAVECADAIIRICDMIGALRDNCDNVDQVNELDMSEAIIKKLEFNRNRADHKQEAREQAGGKRY